MASSRRLRSITDAFNQPFFFERPVVELSSLLANTLLYCARVPHKYALAHAASGFAPHLNEFAGTTEFSTVQHSSAADLHSAAASLKRCLYELLERVWSPRVPSELVVSTYKQLPKPGLDPSRCALLGESEYEATGGRYVRYRDSLELHWTSAVRLSASGDFLDVLVPAVLVYPGFGVTHPSERFVPMLSSGIAAGQRFDETILRGIYELVERDAFAISWLARLRPPRISLDGAPIGEGERRILRDLQDDGFKAAFFDLTLDIPIPVVMAVITNPARGEPFSAALGLGCSLDPLVALRHAFAEALQQLGNSYSFVGGTTVQRKEPGTAKRQVSLPAFEASLQDFLASETETRLVENSAAGSDARVPEQLLAAADILAEHKLELIVCDLAPDEAAAAGRFCLTRVVIPGLQPHLYEADCWRLANGRLREVPVRLGRSAAPLAEDDFNRAPNPFAWSLA